MGLFSLFSDDVIISYLFRYTFFGGKSFSISPCCCFNTTEVYLHTYTLLHTRTNAHTHTFVTKAEKCKSTQVTSHVVIVSKEGHTFPHLQRKVFQTTTITFNSVGKFLYIYVVVVCYLYSHTRQYTTHTIFMVKNSNTTCNTTINVPMCK